MDTASATEPLATPGSPTLFTPLADAERIEALDVVRGFALFGIFLMNIEWFNRPFSSFDEGMPRGLTGLDWLASGFIFYFVQGKFWTIFALLFGMGFAVMLVRAERTGRAFTRIYLRRILALAVFGALHFICIWDGDILFSYAIGALAMLIVLYGRALPILAACVGLMGLGSIPGADAFFGAAAALAATGMLALYLRGEKRLAWRGVSMPVFCVIVLLAGVLLSIAAAVLWLLPDAPIEPRLPLSALGPLLLVTGWLAWKYHEPADKRSLRTAVGVYVLAGVAMTAIGLLQYVTPDPVAAIVSADRNAAAAGPAAKPKKTGEERVAEMKAEREKRLAEQATRKAEEIKVLTSGRYLDTVEWRSRRFLENLPRGGGFAVILAGMFLLGAWFVRSGVMDDTAKHLAFFRKLALYGLPAGIGLGLLTAFIAMSHTPGERHDGWGIAQGLLMLGNLPACLGYVGLVVTALHSRSAWSRIRVLALPGRMALTHYLLQSLICMSFFYGFGLGHWGMSRSQQVMFVVLVYALQIALSHWWLSRFRYGPIEWLWRGFTYRQLPPLCIPRTAAAVPTQAA
ncbi:MAG TPA: DUF418 domain-containing protein [Albitalea sp.]|nr:DUF418 domain-containing protein [Albitalea sp.]